MRIAFLHHLTLTRLGGGEIWIMNVAKELQALGHDVKVYATPVKVSSGVPANPQSILGNIPYSEGYGHNIDADVTYVTYHPTYSINFKAPKIILGVHATTCWEHFDYKYGLLPNSAIFLHKIFSKAEFNKAKAVHLVAPYLEVKHPNVYRIPNFVDSQKFTRSNQCKNKFVVAFASRKTYQKGWDVFLALQQSFASNKNIDFVSSSNLPESEVPKFIAQANVVVVPSRYDSYGLVIVEAAMCCCHVITTRLPSHLALNLPLTFADGILETKNAILSLYKSWLNNPVAFSSEETELRKKAIALYDKQVIMKKLNQMFKEVVA